MLLSLLLALAASPADTLPLTVIVVRHAEKASATERDPTLSAAGWARAAALDSVLAEGRVSAIVVTEYKRTAETASLVAKRHGLVPIVVPAGNAAKIAETVRALRGTVLVVGHSNTVPAIVRALGGAARPDLCDASYAQLFSVTPGASAVVVRSRFGAPDPAGAEACGGMTPK